MRSRPSVLLWILALSLTLLPTPSQSQDGGVSRKLLRQIGVMEKIFSQVLVDSPNFLVSGRGNVRGTYLEEFGVLLTFEASLVGKDHWDGENWPGAYRIETDKHGRTVLILPDDADEDEWDEDEWDEDPEDRDDDDDDDYRDDRDRDRDDRRDDRRSWDERRNRTERRLYARGKTELEDALIDYGDTLTRLKDDQWIAIAAFLRESNFFVDEKISRLIMRVKLKDLRAFASGKIEEAELRRIIVTEEY